MKIADKVDAWSAEGAAVARTALEDLEAGHSITLKIDNPDVEGTPLTLNRDHPQYRRVVLILNRIMLQDRDGFLASR